MTGISVRIDRFAAIPVRLDIAPSTEDNSPDQVIGITDVLGVLDGFQGNPYPGDGPLGCP